MVFKRKAHTALASILNGKRERNKTVHIIFKSDRKTISNQMLFHSPEQNLFLFDPAHQSVVRSTFGIDVPNSSPRECRKLPSNGEFSIEFRQHLIQQIFLCWLGYDSNLLKD